MSDEEQKAVVLLSGGPDSAALLGQTISKGIQPIPINFQFGLRTDKAELRAARNVAEHFGVEVDVFDLANVTGMLGNLRHTIHSEAHVLRFGTATLLSISSCYAILKKASKVLVALHKQDSEESPEYTQPFLSKLQEALAIARSCDDISIEAPFINLSKVEVLKIGNESKVPFELTWSCLVGGEEQCGGCRACRARKKAFSIAELADNAPYAS